MKNNKKTPRADQAEAINAGEAHFSFNDRGRMTITCGGGKTLTSLWLSQRLEAKNLLIALPRLVLQEQSVATWLSEIADLEGDKKLLAIGSDKSIEEHHNVSVTTDPLSIAKFLQSDGNKVVFVMYQSVDALIEAFKLIDYKFMFHLLIADEADVTTGKNSKSYAKLLYDDCGISIHKRLFMTATPRFFQGDEVVSMDDETLYGEEFYSLSTQEAIEKGILCDYKVLVMYLKKTDLKSTAEELAAEGLKKAIAQYNLRKTISYHANNQRAKQFANDFDTVQTYYVHHRQSAKVRRPIFEAFRTTADPALIANCDILSFGFDMPETDCVAFIDPRQSQRDVVQSVGRVLRRDPKNPQKKGYVFLPVVVTSEGILDEKAFSATRRALAAMASMDVRIGDFFRKRGTKNKKLDAADLVQESENDVTNFDFEPYKDLLKVIVWKNIRTLFWRGYEDAKKWAQENVVPLGVDTYAKWYAYNKGEACFDAPKRPIDIPISLQVIYKKEGFDPIDFFGKAKWDYEMAKAWVAENLKGEVNSAGKWAKYLANNAQFSHLPKLPSQIRRDLKLYKEYTTHADFLGYDNSYLTLEAAKAWIAENLKGEIKGTQDWEDYVRGKRFTHLPSLPKNIKKSPKMYGVTVWDLIGVEKKEIDFWDYETAKAWVVENLKGEIQTAEDFRAYKNGNGFTHLPKLPIEIRRTPKLYPEFVSINDFLGVPNFVTFNEAKKLIKPLIEQYKIDTSTKWMHEMPMIELEKINVPRNVKKIYKTEWQDWADFLGITN